MKRHRTQILVIVATIALVATSHADPTVVWTTRGGHIFSRSVVLKIGGVVLQGTTTFVDERGSELSPEHLRLVIHQHQTQERVCIERHRQLLGLTIERTCFKLPVAADTAANLARWVLGGGTAAFTALDPSGDADYPRAVPVRSGLAPRELAHEPLALYLRYLDFALLVHEVGDTPAAQENNARIGNIDRDLRTAELYSWIVSDLDTEYRTTLSNNHVHMKGLLYRYDLELYKESDYALIVNVNRACDPDSITVIDWYDYDSPNECTLTRDYDDQFYDHDDLDEGRDFGSRSTPSYDRLALHRNALLLAHVVAIIRTLGTEDPDAMRSFVAAVNQR